MKTQSSQCPSLLCQDIISTSLVVCRLCPHHRGLCPYQLYPVGITYSKVCSRIIGYQTGSPDAYSSLHSNGGDGVLLSYGKLEVNIWAFFAAIDENYANPTSVCPCINPSDTTIPSVPDFFGNNYFCDTVSTLSSLF